MLAVRYFIWNSRKLNYLLIGMVISMMAFASTSLIISGLSNEIDSLTASVQDDTTSVIVSPKKSNFFTGKQLEKLDNLISELNINPSGLTRYQLEKKFNETSIISNLQYRYSLSVFGNISRLGNSIVMHLTITNISQVFSDNSINFQKNNTFLIDKTTFANHRNFLILGETYVIKYNNSIMINNPLRLQTTFPDTIEYGILMDWSAINLTQGQKFNRLEFSVISESVTEGLVTKNDLQKLLNALQSIDDIKIDTNSLVSQYLTVSKEDVIRLLRILLISIFALILVSIVNSTYLLIEESMQEIRVLKSIGFSRYAVIILFVKQFIMVSLFASVFSFLFSIVIVNLIFSLLAMVFNNVFIVGEASFDILVLLLSISTITSVLGTIIGIVIKKLENGEFL